MSTLKRICAIWSILFLLTACTPSIEKYERHTVPPYFVMLTDWNVYQTIRCSGIAVSEDTVITAAHCFKNNLMVSRILTQYNQEFRICESQMFGQFGLSSTS